MLKNSGSTTRSGFSCATSSMYAHALATFSSRASALLCIWTSASLSVLTGLNGRRARAEPLAEAGPLDVAAVPRLGDELTVLDDDLTADERDRRLSGHLGSFVQVVVAGRVVRLHRQGVLAVGVEDDEVGVAADRDRPLARVEPEELRGLRRVELDEPVEVEASRADAELVQDHQAILDARRTVRDLREVVPAERLLVVEPERRVVGRDHRQRVGPQRFPERLEMVLLPRRRRVDVLRALETSLVDVRVVDPQVL